MFHSVFCSDHKAHLWHAWDKSEVRMHSLGLLEQEAV